MKIKRILVAVDGSTVAMARLETGFNLASAMNASLSAIYVIPIYMPTIAAGTMHGGWYMGQEMLTESRRQALDAAADVKSACERLSDNYSLSLDWIQKEGELVATIGDEARYHDLLLIGKPDTVNEPEIRNSDVNGILLSSGRPCLMVPGATPCLKQNPRNVVVGWDGSREAALAMQQSMPFLEAAESVMVVSAYKMKERRETVEEENKSIVHYLHAHEVNASGHVLAKDNLSTGQLLAKYTEESESELLVMGAYGHSRFREVVLGGATHYILHHAPVPTLFAH